MGDNLSSKVERGNAFYRSGNIRRNGRVARFDHVHTDAVQHFRDLNFFIHCEVDIGCLLAFT